MSVVGRLLCFLGRHDLHSLKRLGVSEHIACARCFRQFGINHAVRGVLPWSADMADMYQRHWGYDDRSNFAAWRQWVQSGDAQ